MNSAVQSLTGVLHLFSSSYILSVSVLLCTILLTRPSYHVVLGVAGLNPPALCGWRTKSLTEAESRTDVDLEDGHAALSPASWLTFDDDLINNTCL